MMIKRRRKTMARCMSVRLAVGITNSWRMKRRSRSRRMRRTGRMRRRTRR
jgi:hypothetical protein